MKIVLNHLTRMHGGNVCVAGVEADTCRHVRPVLGYQGMPSSLLAPYGGPFDMGRLIDLGRPRARLVRPHVEDYEFAPSRVKFEHNVAPEEFWKLLQMVSKASFEEIFGEQFRPLLPGRFGTELGRGDVSLGCLRPQCPPELYVRERRGGKVQIRIKLSDGRIEADASVTDLRLCHPDHATPDVYKVRGVARWIEDSREVILGVGLTRKFRTSEESPYYHWLQVNNIHLREDPVWQLS